MLDVGWNILSFEWWSPVWMHHLIPQLPKESDTNKPRADDAGPAAADADAVQMTPTPAATAHSSLSPLLPFVPSSFPVWTDFWIAIPLALVITVVRLWVMDPIATRIVVSRLNLSPTSLRQRNAKEPAGKRIPKWVLNEIDGFALDMLIVSGQSHAVPPPRAPAAIRARACLCPCTIRLSAVQQR